MHFPRPFQIQSNGCIAVIAKIGGVRKIAGPLLKGRAQTEFEGEIWKGARLSYHLNCQAIPKTPISLKHGVVMHSCDNGWCINPEHLSLGTQKQNQIDMYARSKTVIARMSASKMGNINSRGQKWTAERLEQKRIFMIGNTNKKKGVKQRPKIKVSKNV
jgi:hypothetical protein